MLPLFKSDHLSACVEDIDGLTSLLEEKSFGTAATSLLFAIRLKRKGLKGKFVTKSATVFPGDGEDKTLPAVTSSAAVSKLKAPLEGGATEGAVSEVESTPAASGSVEAT